MFVAGRKQNGRRRTEVGDAKSGEVEKQDIHMAASEKGRSARPGIKADEDEYLTVAEVCNYLRISRSTFYVLLSDRGLGLVRIVERPKWAGGRIRIASWRLREWAAATSN